MVVTPKHGLLIFPQTRTLNIINNRIVSPPEFINNTVAVLGFKPKQADFYATVRVYANEDGKLSTTRFDGYEGEIGIDISVPIIKTYLDNALDGYMNQSEKNSTACCIRKNRNR